MSPAYQKQTYTPHGTNETKYFGKTRTKVDNVFVTYDIVNEHVTYILLPKKK